DSNCSLPRERMRRLPLIAIVWCLGCASSRLASPPPARPSAAELELRSMFEQDVQPIVTYWCAGCHAGRGCCSKFLEADMYETVKSWPRMVGPTPARSLLFTKGSHEGPAFRRGDAKVIAAWIRAEARQS